MKTFFVFIISFVLMIALPFCGKKELAKGVGEMTLAQKIARFSPTEISADVSKLPENEKRVLDKIIDASRLMDPVYLRQVWAGNVELLKTLESDTTEAGKERLHFFRINMGPWSQLDSYEPFIDGVQREKPPGANYYPEDMAKEEFEKWVASLPESKREKATGFFYVIRRGRNGVLKTVPYSEEYKEWLDPSAKLLREAAGLTGNKTLRKFLQTRAAAFTDNDYYASDIAWMELDAPIDLTIGPYETYMDELFGYKAAFEVFVTLRDDEETEKLKKFSGYLQDIENNLPLEQKYKNPKIGAMSPIRVVDVIYAAGEGNRGVQTAAFNLPNDEKIVREKGSKRVMLKNMQEAKFSKILVPISKVVLPQAQHTHVSFDAFFTHILAHELMHGIGPHNIIVDGRPTNVRQELKEYYSAIEEAKADITGLFALQYLIDKGLLNKKLEDEMYVTFLASMFRSVRFGIKEAHGKGVAIQFNYLMDEGAITADENEGTVSIVRDKIAQAVKKLTGEILTLEAVGSYDGAKEMTEKYVKIRPVMKKGLDKLGDIPIDIEPIFINVPKKTGSIR